MRWRVQAGVVQNLDSTRTQVDAAGLVEPVRGPAHFRPTQSGNQLVSAPNQAARRPDRRDGGDRPAPRAWKAPGRSRNQEQAQQQLTNFLNYGSGYQAGSVQMFH